MWLDSELCREFKRHLEHGGATLTPRKHFGFGDSCFVSCVLLDIIQPHKIHQDHLWQKVFVIILDFQTAKILNKNMHPKPREDPPVSPGTLLNATHEKGLPQ